MAIPDGNSELTRAQYEYYKNAGRLAKLWYALTVIALIIWILSFLIACVGAILSAGTVTYIVENLLQGY